MRDWLQQHESDYAEEFGGPASGIKGHSIPCQYHVLHKDHRLSDFGTGDLQVVTYQLWHMKTVSYVSPQDCNDHKIAEAMWLCLDTAQKGGSPCQRVLVRLGGCFS